MPDKGDTAWVLTCAAIVIFMTLPGLALFYGGLVRSKNVLSVLMQSLVVFSLVAVLWALYGYSFAFTEGSAVHRRPRPAVAARGSMPRRLAATFTKGVYMPGTRVLRVPGRVRLHHLRADRRCLRRTR